MTTTTAFVPKRTKHGDFIWTASGRSGFALIGEGTTSRVQVTSHDLVRIDKTTKGWDLVIEGEVIETYCTRSDAKFDAYEYMGWEF
jgi:hypothetical protein